MCGAEEEQKHVPTRLLAGCIGNSSGALYGLKNGGTFMAIVFQYGSNMSTSRLNSSNRLCGDAKPIGIAKTIECFELDFTVWSKCNNCAAADIVPVKGRNIWGVLYEIPEKLLSRKTCGDRKSLDAIEGEGTNYLRTEISLINEEGKRLSAITYVAKNRNTDLKTSGAYAQHIFDGIEEHQLPQEYRRYVLSRFVKNNSALSQELCRLYGHIV